MWQCPGAAAGGRVPRKAPRHLRASRHFGTSLDWSCIHACTGGRAAWHDPAGGRTDSVLSLACPAELQRMWHLPCRSLCKDAGPYRKIDIRSRLEMG